MLQGPSSSENSASAGTLRLVTLLMWWNQMSLRMMRILELGWAPVAAAAAAAAAS